MRFGDERLNLIGVHVAPARDVQRRHVIEQVLERSLDSTVVVTSRRLVPCETPPDSRLLYTVRRVRPEAKVFGSPTCSDWVFLRQADAIKCGPGTSRRSHTPDEYVDLPEVSAARRFYADVVRAYLAGH